MSKLLSANFMRLKKSMSFWIGMIIMSAAGIIAPIKRYTDMRNIGFGQNIEIGLFGCIQVVGVIMAVFCSLFIGTEHSDGTIRNKIITGQRRTTIYLSNVIISSIVGELMCAVYFIPYLCIGIPLLGGFSVDMKIILLFALTVFLLAIVFSSVFTLIAMLCQRKAVVVVRCMLFAYGFLLTGVLLNAMLEEPETITTYSLNEDKEMVSEEILNPRYLEGTKRAIVQTLYDINPGGQGIQCELLEAVNPERLPLYSLALVILTSGTGIFFFKKKDLK